MSRLRRVRRIALVVLVASVLPMSGLIPAQAALASTNTRPSWVPSRAGLVLDDGFDGSSIDASHWTTCYPWADPRVGCTNPPNGEQEWYVPGQVRTAGGVLRLVADRIQTDGFGAAGLPVSYPYRSGMIASAGRFSFTYGFVEIRAQIPRGQAMWPALWLLPTSWAWPPEIDMMEAVGQAPTTVALTLHATDGSRPQQFVSGTDFSVGWHTFGIAWSPGLLTWYVDGVARMTVRQGVPAEPMYLLANLAVGGVGGGPVTGDTPTSAAFAIDRVRVWQR